MTKQQAHSDEKPASAGDEGRVVPFRQRQQLQNAAGRQSPANRPVSDETGQARDLSRYERPAEHSDEFRRRIVLNLSALIFMMVLIGVGVWLAVSITHLRDIQDCILSGRRDCTVITVPQS